MERSKLLDAQGRPLTQSLFLELQYNDYAVYTLKDDDYEYKGNLYPSLKKLYLAMEDIVEYDFANEYLLGWQHWVRLGENKLIRNHIDEWREELELKIRSRAVREMIKTAPESFQAAKWLSDRGWAVKAPGRPSKSDIEHEKKMAARVKDDYEGDVIRLFQNKG